MSQMITPHELPKVVEAAVGGQQIVDMHTHLYPPSFGTSVENAGGPVDPNGLLLWGVDELVTYHYLVAEVYRVVPATVLPYEQFWKLSKRQQADHIWKHLFVERTPVSEACRGVLTTLHQLGIDLPAGGDRGLNEARKYFASKTATRHIDNVMQLANVEKITMTNAVFDDNERNRWLADPNVGRDPRFSAVLRIDPMLRDWPNAAKKLSAWGYEAGAEPDARSIESARRFLRDWIERMGAIYLAVSLPPEFRYPAAGDGPTGRAGQAVLENVVLPVCAERGLPFAMMIGSKLRVNPALGDAGDMLGKADVMSVANLCQAFQQNKFFVTMLSRENQHELCVAARKFGNLMPFGCWWFLNNPGLIEEMTRMRVELLGPSFIPQHSDARVLDQLIYKWQHTRKILTKVLTDKYNDLLATGWKLSAEDIRRDVRGFFKSNFESFLAR